MNDVSLVHVLKSECQLSEDSLRLGDRQHSIDRSGHVVVEIASSSELHGEEQSIADLDSIMELDDVRVREGSHEIGFSDSVLALRIRGIELLDDDGLSSRLADGHVDGAVVSAVEPLSELVSLTAERAKYGIRSWCGLGSLASGGRTWRARSHGSRRHGGRGREEGRGRLRRRVCNAKGREREEGVGGTIEMKRMSGSFIVEPRRCSE